MRRRRRGINLFKNKYYLDFDGTNKYVSHNTISGIKSISFWLNSKDSHYWHCLFKGDLFMYKAEFLHIPDGLGGYIDSSNFIIDTWYHIIIEINVNVLKYYINNSYDSQGVTNYSSTSVDQFGGGPGAYLNGFLDEIDYYNKLLSSSEKSLLFGGGTPQTCGDGRKISGHLAGYRCGDKDNFPTIPDQSGNGNDGTMQNMEAGDIKAY